VKHLNSCLIATALLLIFAGCSTTKIDLYKYKDTSSVTIVDDNKVNYEVKRPKLDSNVIVDTNGWYEYDKTVREYFLAYNDKTAVFKLDQNGSYKLKITLHNVSSNQKYTPPKYVEKKRKVQTDKGVIIKDESYYTDPYWTYTVETAAVAHLSSPQNDQKFFESDNTLSYSVTGRYSSKIPGSKYVESLQGTLAKLLKQIANEVAPEALVVSKKVAIDDDEDFIFLVNMGQNEGLREGQKLLVFKEIVFKDEINAKTITNKVRIGTATVSNQITNHYAWMMMDDEDHSSAIEVGDIIRPRY